MKHTFLILTTLALIVLSACSNKEEEAAAAAAEKVIAHENASAEFFNTVGSFDFDILSNIKTNAGKNFMMYELPAKTLIGVENGENVFKTQLTKTHIVKKIPGKNAFFKGDHRITKWDPLPKGYGVEYHEWPGRVVSTDLLITYADNKLVKGGIYDGWLRVESIAHLKEWREPGKKVALVGILPLYYVQVYEYEGEIKGALKSRHLLFADEVR
jgi:hypothetical protein